MTVKGILILALGFLLISAALIMGDRDILTIIVLWMGLMIAWFGHVLVTMDDE